MEGAGLAGWHFIVRDPGRAAPNRIEWDFTLLPYAGGEVRRFFPMRETGGMDLHLGSHRLICGRGQAYLHGEYQTTTFGQEAVQGGDSDPDLAGFLVRLDPQSGEWLQRHRHGAGRSSWRTLTCGDGVCAG